MLILRPWHAYYYYHDRKRFFNRSLADSARFILWMMGLKTSVSGKENVPLADGRYLIAANHQSYLDIPVLSSTLPGAFVQREIPYMPGFAWYFGRISLIIKRESPLSIIRVIKYAKRMTVEQGIPVIIFPEATRSIDGKLGEMHLGVAAVAKNLKLAILPVTICNSRDLLPKGAIHPKHGTVLVSIQPLIEARFMESHSVEEINQEMKRRIQNGLDNAVKIK